MISSPADSASGVDGKDRGAAAETADVGVSTDEAVEARTMSAVARPRLPMVMAAAPKPPKVVYQ